MSIGVPVQYVVVAGDIVTGQVTVRLRYAMSSATNRTLFADTNGPLQVQLTNYGPN
jgi:hypothetical protein